MSKEFGSKLAPKILIILDLKTQNQIKMFRYKSKNRTLKHNLHLTTLLTFVVRIVNITPLFFLFFFYSTFTNAQGKSLDKTFKRFLEEGQLTFSQPEPYFGLDSVQNYDPSPKYLHSLLLYSIKNKQNDIIIAFALIKIVEPNELVKKMFPKSQEVNNLMPYLITEADSSVSTPIKIDETNLKKLNADNGYIYNMKIIYPYLNKYTYCKKALIHKNNVCRAEILYFYTKKEDDKIVDETIKKTWGMLKFKS